jgi:hypothetical protein
MNQNGTAHQNTNANNVSQLQVSPGQAAQQTQPKPRNFKKVSFFILAILLLGFAVLLGTNYKYNYLSVNFFQPKEEAEENVSMSTRSASGDYLFAKLNKIEDAEDEFSLISVSSDFTKTEEIVSDETPFYYSVVTSPPKISPDKKYLYVNTVGIIDLKNNKIIENKINKNSVASCAWYNDSKKLSCISSDEIAEFKTRYKISDLLISGKEVVHEDKTLSMEIVLDENRNPVYKENHNHFFRNRFGAVGVRNDNEVILFSGSHQGVGKYKIGTKMFSWIYRPMEHESDMSSTPIAVYSDVNDKLFYINSVDRGVEIRDTKKRYSRNLVMVDLKTGVGKNIWTQDGDETIGNLFLSVDQGRLVFSFLNEDNKLSFHIVKVSDYNDESKSYSFGFDYGLPKPRLLGFSHDGQGFIVFEKISQNLNTPVTSKKLTYKYVVSRFQDDKKTVMIEDTCEVDIKTEQKTGECGEYVLAI